SWLYDRVRLEFGPCRVRTTGGQWYPVGLPANRFEFPARVPAVTGETTACNLDVRLAESLRVTPAGQYAMTPVLHADVLAGVASVQLVDQATKQLRIWGGTSVDDRTWKMNAAGEVVPAQESSYDEAGQGQDELCVRPT